MAAKKRVHNFLFPSLTRDFFLRAILIGMLAYVFFYYICLPIKINGASMEPSYRDGSINFTWRPGYFFSSPDRFDVVTVRFAGKSIMLLKRVIALEGEKVEFRSGALFINGKEIHEPHIKSPYNWNLPPRFVKKGNVYVVGDNRNMPMNQHTFGQTSIKRITGTPLW